MRALGLVQVKEPARNAGDEVRLLGFALVVRMRKIEIGDFNGLLAALHEEFEKAGCPFSRFVQCNNPWCYGKDMLGDV